MVASDGPLEEKVNLSSHRSYITGWVPMPEAQLLCTLWPASSGHPLETLQPFIIMAQPTILKIPEEVLQAILKECRTWYHPSVKNNDAAPIDFGTYSDFHLRLDYVKYLPVLLTCRTFLRIALPLAYECVSLVSPVLHGQERRPPFPEHYTMLPRRDSGRIYSSLSDQLHIIIINYSPQGIERSLTTLTCQSRPKIAGSCRALSIDPRLPVT